MRRTLRKHRRGDRTRISRKPRKSRKSRANRRTRRVIHKHKPRSPRAIVVRKKKYRKSNRRKSNRRKSNRRKSNRRKSNRRKSNRRKGGAPKGAPKGSSMKYKVKSDQLVEDITSFSNGGTYGEAVGVGIAHLFEMTKKSREFLDKFHALIEQGLTESRQNDLQRALTLGGLKRVNTVMAAAMHDMAQNHRFNITGPIGRGYLRCLIITALMIIAQQVMIARQACDRISERVKGLDRKLTDQKTHKGEKARNWMSPEWAEGLTLERYNEILNGRIRETTEERDGALVRLENMRVEDNIDIDFWGAMLNAFHAGGNPNNDEIFFGYNDFSEQDEVQTATRTLDPVSRLLLRSHHDAMLYEYLMYKYSKYISPHMMLHVISQGVVTIESSTLSLKVGGLRNSLVKKAKENMNIVQLLGGLASRYYERFDRLQNQLRLENPTDPTYETVAVPDLRGFLAGANIMPSEMMDCKALYDESLVGLQGLVNQPCPSPEESEEILGNHRDLIYHSSIPLWRNLLRSAVNHYTIEVVQDNKNEAVGDTKEGGLTIEDYKLMRQHVVIEELRRGGQELNPEIVLGKMLAWMEEEMEEQTYEFGIKVFCRQILMEYNVRLGDTDKIDLDADTLKQMVQAIFEDHWEREGPIGFSTGMDPGAVTYMSDQFYKKIIVPYLYYDYDDVSEFKGQLELYDFPLQEHALYSNLQVDVRDETNANVTPGIYLARLWSLGFRSIEDIVNRFFLSEENKAYAECDRMFKPHVLADKLGICIPKDWSNSFYMRAHHLDHNDMSDHPSTLSEKFTDWASLNDLGSPNKGILLTMDDEVYPAKVSPKFYEYLVSKYEEAVNDDTRTEENNFKDELVYYNFPTDQHGRRHQGSYYPVQPMYQNYEALYEESEYSLNLVKDALYGSNIMGWHGLSTKDRYFKYLQQIAYREADGQEVSANFKSLDDIIRKMSEMVKALHVENPVQTPKLNQVAIAKPLNEATQTELAQENNQVDNCFFDVGTVKVSFEITSRSEEYEYPLRFTSPILIGHSHEVAPFSMAFRHRCLYVYHGTTFDGADTLDPFYPPSFVPITGFVKHTQRILPEPEPEPEPEPLAGPARDGRVSGAVAEAGAEAGAEALRAFNARMDRLSALNATGQPDGRYVDWVKQVAVASALEEEEQEAVAAALAAEERVRLSDELKAKEAAARIELLTMQQAQDDKLAAGIESASEGYGEGDGDARLSGKAFAEQRKVASGVEAGRLAAQAKTEHRVAINRGALKLFDELDTDGDGFLSKVELDKYLEELGNDDLGSMLAMTMMDINQDGKISKSEFIKWITERGYIG